jgi:hypothetical protein
MWVGTDISSAIDIAQDRLFAIRNMHFVQTDILEPPYPAKVFDMILSRGKALADVKAEVEVPLDVPYLGIKAGTYPVHRMFYDYFVKAFWKSDWAYDESALISFDWYHPHYAFRHTPDEIQRWCDECGLRTFHMESSWTGLTVRATKVAGAAAAAPAL